SITISGSGYTLSGDRIILGGPFGGTSIIVNAGAVGNTIAFDIQMGGAAGNIQFFTVNSGADLTLTGRLSGTTGVELAKEGSGTLIFQGDNSAFTGPIVVALGI